MNNSRSAMRWWIVAGYAVAMAWVEAAVVYYLRTMLHRIEPHQPNPLPMIGELGPAEMVREAATLIMLLAVGMLAGRGWRDRLGFAAMAFGIWDIFYYVFLKALCGWPHSVFDWDILFLLPLPWWGPVLAPVLISVLMILWGTLAVGECPSETAHRREAGAWLFGFCGMGLALYVFMADTIHAASLGAEAVRNVLPVSFDWPRFSLALLLMSAPAILALRRFLLRAGASTALVVTGGPVGGCNPLLGTLTQGSLSEAGGIRPVDQG
jgi:hypothetical protein